MRQSKKLKGPGGLKVILDRSKYDREDPGSDTPALVVKGDYSASLSCAASEGELLGTNNVLVLTETQCQWLAEIEDDAWDFLEGRD